MPQAHTSRRSAQPPSERHDVVVIGAGQAGLAMSYRLSAYGREHVVLERASVGDRWRNERWDSLHFQFPNSFIRLPGFPYQGPEPHRFSHYREILRYIEAYREKIRAPVVDGVGVDELTLADDGAQFRLTAEGRKIVADAVVIATGPFQSPMIPDLATRVPAHVAQLTANRYRNPDQLAPGAVLVVGSGSSGCQIAEELNQAGRRVYLSVGRHRRIPHRYRGRFTLEWLADLGLFHTPLHMLPGGAMPPPLVVSGVNGGHGINLRRFAEEGVTLFGRLRGVEDETLQFGSDVEERLTEADRSAAEFAHRIDEHIDRLQLDAPEAHAIDLEEPARNRRVPAETALDLRRSGIATIIWCTGYRFDFGWVRLPIFDDAGGPRQTRGVTAVPGAYFLGLHWMHTFASGTLFGIADDSQFLAERMLDAQLDPRDPGKCGPPRLS